MSKERWSGSCCKTKRKEKTYFSDQFTQTPQIRTHEQIGRKGQKMSPGGRKKASGKVAPKRSSKSNTNGEKKYQSKKQRRQ